MFPCFPFISPLFLKYSTGSRWKYSSQPTLNSSHNQHSIPQLLRVYRIFLILIHSIFCDLGGFFLCKITYMLECFPPPEICHLIVSSGLFSTTLLPPASPPSLQDRRQSPLAKLQLNIKSWCANGDDVNWRAGAEERRRWSLLPAPVSLLPIIEVSFFTIKTPGKFRSQLGQEEPSRPISRFWFGWKSAGIHLPT